MTLMVYVLTMMAILSAVILLMGKILKNKMLQDFEGSSPFECGFNPLIISFKPFSIRFFILGLMFLIFDVELILLYPFLSTKLFSFNVISQFIFVIFVILLSLGFFVEWNFNKIEWLK